MSKISEAQLILPSLFVIYQHKGTMRTSDLIEKLREILNPQGDDLVILSKRNDDKFSQKVRNLKSHNTLEKYEYVTYDNDQKVYRITQKGNDYLKRNFDVLTYLLNNNFEYNDVVTNLSNITQKNLESDKIKVEQFEEDLLITEGTQSLRKLKVYKRSNKLRTHAIKHFQKNGTIACEACGFNFEEFYGELGKGFIEIHHAKPIYQYEGDDIEKTIKEALKNVVPLCSNCHKMIHKKTNETISVQHLKKEILKTNSKNF